MSSPRYRSPDRRHLTLDHVLGAGAVDFRPVAVAIARDATLSPSCLGKSANLTKAIGTLSGTEIEVNMTSPTIVVVWVPASGVVQGQIVGQSLLAEVPVLPKNGRGNLGRADFRLVLGKTS